MSEDDYSYSQSLKPGQISGSKGKPLEKTSEARRRLEELEAAAQKEEEQRRLKEIMAEQKASLKKRFGDSSDSDETDDNLEREPQQLIAAKTKPAKPKQDPYKYFMEKAGKHVSESESISLIDEPETAP